MLLKKKPFYKIVELLAPHQKSINLNSLTSIKYQKGLIRLDWSYLICSASILFSQIFNLIL